MPILRRSHSSAPTFEIKLVPENPRSVFLLKGTAEEAAPVRVAGNVSLSALEAMAVKKVTVKLQAVLRLRWSEQIASNTVKGQTITHPVRYDSTLYENEQVIFDSSTGHGSRSGVSQSVPASPMVGSMQNLSSYFQSGHTSNLSALTSRSQSVVDTSSSGGSQTATSVSGSRSGGNSPALGSRSSSSISLKGLASAASLSRSGHQPSRTPPSLSRNPSASNLGGLLHGKHGKEAVGQLSAGSHNFPFEFLVPSDITETIEGNESVQIVYWLSATAERGRMSSNLSSQRYIRIIRSLGVDSYDAAATVSIENTWPDKVDYSIEVPTRSIPLGSEVSVRFKLQPLAKGLGIGKVKLALCEVTHLSTTLGHATNYERVVCEKVFEPEEVSETSDEWIFVRHMQIPHSLSKSTPDIQLRPYIKIVHKIKAFVSLINPDKHISELRAALPVQLFISPHVSVSAHDLQISQNPRSMNQAIPTGEEEELFPDVPHTSSGAITPSENIGADTAAPPNYQAHVFDRLWSEVPTPMESPSRELSNIGTPGLPAGSSRQSAGTLTDLDASQRAELIAGLNALALSQSESAPPLESRRSSLDLSSLNQVPTYDLAMMDGVDTEAAPNYD